jgi:hypothetical protein
MRKSSLENTAVIYKMCKNRSQNRVHKIELHTYWTENRRNTTAMLGREF